MKTIKVISVFLIGILWVGVIQASAIEGKFPAVTKYADGIHVSFALKIDPCKPIIKEYDFSTLTVGQFMEFPGYDPNGIEFTYRVTRVKNGIDVAVKSETLRNIDRNTTVIFRGSDGIIKTVVLGQLASQRCGWLCILAHVCCVQVHIGPPGNTWHWDCKCIGTSED